MTHRLFQVGQAGAAPDYRDFFDFPTVTVQEIRDTIRASFGEDFSDFKDSIAVGAVLNDKKEIVGELVMTGGHDAYCVQPDGSRKKLKDDDRIGFFQLAHFKPEKESFFLTVDNLEDLKQKILQFSPTKSEAFAVRIKGNFPEITFRSVNTENAEAKGKRYPCCLADLCEHQQVRSEKEVTATLSGFYSAKGALEEGTAFDDMLHLHGQSDDLKLGGHVLDFKGPATVQVEIMPEIGQWMQMTREHAQEVSQPKWVNKIRIPKHMAQAILEMPYGEEKFSDYIQKVESRIETRRTQLQKLRDINAPEIFIQDKIGGIEQSEAAEGIYAVLTRMAKGLPIAPSSIEAINASIKLIGNDVRKFNQNLQPMPKGHKVSYKDSIDFIENLDADSISAGASKAKAVLSALIDLKNELKCRERGAA